MKLLFRFRCDSARFRAITAILVCLLAAGIAHAQGVLMQLPPITNSQGQPLAGVTVSVFTASGTLPNLVCGSPAGVFKDQGLTTPFNVSNTNQVVTDGFGNFPFWIAASATPYGFTVGGANTNSSVCYGFTAALPAGTTPAFNQLTVTANSNGIDIISATRATDSGPTGNFVNFKSLAGVTVFKIDISGNITAVGGAFSGPVSTGALISTSVTAPNLNGDLWVGPGTNCPVNASFYSSLQACYTASIAGQFCHVCGNWTDPTWTSNLTMSKSHTGFIFHGNATIPMSTFSLIMPDLDGNSTKLIGVHVEGVFNPPGDPNVPGVVFNYTGNGKAFEIGDGSAQSGSGNHVVSNLDINLTNAGSSAKGLYIQDAVDNWFINLFVHTSANSGTSQIGVVCDGSTGSSGCSANNFYNYLASVPTGIQFLNSGASGNFVYGGRLCCQSSGTAIDMRGGGNIVEMNVNGYGTAVSMANSASVNGNRITVTPNPGGGNTTDYSEVSGASNASHDNYVNFLYNSSAVSTNGKNCVTMTGRVTCGAKVLNQQGASGALTGNSSDQSLFTQYTIPANTVVPGACLQIEVSTRHSTGTASVTYKLNLGGTLSGGNVSGGTIVESNGFANNNTSGFDTITYTLCNDSGSQASQANTSKVALFNLTGFSTIVPTSGVLSNPNVNFTNAQNVFFTFNVANTDQVTPEKLIVAMR